MVRGYTYFLLLMTVLSSGLYGQKRFVPTEPERRLFIPQTSPEALETRTIIDTLRPAAFEDVCGATQVVFPVTEGWGYIAGTNNFGDKEKAQLIQNTTNTTITVNEVWAFFGYVSSVGNGNVRMKIYSVDPANRSPRSLVAQSNDVRVENIQYTDSLFLGTRFSFPLPIVLDDPSFFLSLDISGLYSTFDTVALYHTELGCGDGLEAYELWSDDQWFNVIDAWLTEFGTFEINYALLAIVEFDGPNAVNDPYYAQNKLRLFPATPNPAIDQLQLHYELEDPGPVRVEIYSTDGRQLQQLNLGIQASGRYTQPINVSDLPAGAYVYAIVTDQTRIGSRFVVK